MTPSQRPSLCPNSATLSGRLLDSATRRPIESATYRVESDQRERGVNRFGRFNILGITTATVNVTFNAPGYRSLQARLPVTPLRHDLGDIYMSVSSRRDCLTWLLLDSMCRCCRATR